MAIKNSPEMNPSDPQSRLHKALKVLDTTHDNRLLSHLNACVHCGLCADSCMYYLSTGDEKFIPARKVDLVASVYRRFEDVHAFREEIERLERDLPALDDLQLPLLRK